MIGLGSYAFYWQSSDLNDAPLSLLAQIEKTAELGLQLFQICDYAPLQKMSDEELESVRDRANQLGVTIELGTRGLDTDHLLRFLELAKFFDSTLVRTMVQSSVSDNSVDEAVQKLQAVIREYETAGVSLALETYEQISTRDLVQIVEQVASKNLGICLDVANVVARLENPKECAEIAGEKVNAIHVKDFQFSRQEGWVGFVYSGASLGEGLLDYQHLINTIRPAERGINQVIEHWVPWTKDLQTTIELEKLWTNKSVEYLRSRN
jgi:3-oxoisoapionate decarboxylase